MSGATADSPIELDPDYAEWPLVLPFPEFVYRCDRSMCGTLWRSAERHPEPRPMCPWCFDIPDHLLSKSSPKLSLYTSVITEDKIAELAIQAYHASLKSKTC